MGLRFSKQLALVIHLASRPESGVPRQELASVFWENSGEEEARQSLRALIYQIRRNTDADFLRGESVLSLRREHLAFDVHQFRELRAHNRGEEALRLYRADFLSTVAVPGCTTFEHWADGIRAALAAERHQVLRSLTSQATDAGRWGDAASYADQLVRADPQNVRQRVRLVELLSLAGDRIRASVAADDARSVVRELQGEEGLTRLELALADALGVSRTLKVIPTKGAVRQPDLVGREREYRSIVESWKDCLGGRGSAILITGEAGIGKTRLTRELESRFRHDRAQLARVACYQIEQSAPHGPFLEALRELRAAAGLGGASAASLAVLAAFIPEIADRFRATVSPRAVPIAPETIAETVADALTSLAGDTPTIVVIEDLHWAPAGTVELAHRIARRAASSALMLVLTARDQAAGAATQQALRALTDSPFVREVRLGPLDAGEVQQLLSTIAELPQRPTPEALAHALVVRTGGVPFYVLEVLKLLEETGKLVVQDGRWTASEGLVDDGEVVDAAPALAIVERRLAGTGETAQAVLAALSVVGRHSDSSQLALVSGRDESEVRAALQVLERRRLVLISGGRTTIAHESVAAAALSLVSGEAIRDMHLRESALAEGRAKAGRPGEWSVAARHAALAGDVARAALNAARDGVAVGAQSGPEASVARVRAFVEGLPLSIGSALTSELERVLTARWTAQRWLDEKSGAARRRRRWSAGVGVVAVVASLVGVATRFARPAPAAFGGGYIAIRATTAPGQAHEVRALRLDSNYLLHQAPIDSLPPGVRAGYEPRFVRPDQQRVAFPCARPGHDAVLICVSTPGRADTAVLGNYESDAAFGGWLPDGSAFVMRGGRLMSGHRFVTDLLVMDTTGRVRLAIARGQPSEPVVLAPDGGRVAFGGERMSLVILSTTGRPPTQVPWCGLNAAWSPDGKRMACLIKGGRELVIGDAEPGAVPDRLPLPAEAASGLTWSPDGRFLALLVGSAVRSLAIASRDGSELRHVGDFPSATELLGWVPSTNRAVPSRLLLVPGSVHLGTGSSASISARLATRAGLDVTMVLPIKITVDDTLVARLVGDTMLVGDRAGRTFVTARYGGLADTARVTVVGVQPRLVLREDFNRNLDTSAWKPFGLPASRVIAGLGRHGSGAFHNNGDYSHSSGVVYRRQVPLSRGLTIAFSGYVRAIKNPWQEIDFELSDAMPDSFRAGAGPPQPRDYRSTLVPELSVSATGQALELSIGAFEAHVSAVLPHRFLIGWHRYRTVLYPSGELRFFGDGAVLADVQTSIPRVLSQATLRIGGRSVGTMVLIDDLEVWEGVMLEGARTPKMGGDRRGESAASPSHPVQHESLPR